MFKEKNIRVIFSVILVFLLFCHGLTYIFRTKIKNKKKGIVFETALTVDNFFNSKYQNDVENFLKEKGKIAKKFRKINNTIIFKLFSSTSSGVVIGKDDFLFEKGYIREKFAFDKQDYKTIENNVKKVKEVQDILNKNGIRFLYILAPTKADFYEEYLPKKFDCLLSNNKEEERNYTKFKKALNEYKVNYIDVNEYFIKNKYNSENYLFPKYGIHWSEYGFLKFFDNILNPQYFNNNIICDDFVESKKYLNVDFDLGDLCGIDEDFFKSKTNNIYFRNCKIKDKNIALPKTIFIGDSFSDIIYSNFKDIFIDDTNHFRWWYYKDFWTFDSKKLNNLQVNQIIDILKKKELIIFIHTASNILNHDLEKFFDDIINNFNGK